MKEPAARLRATSSGETRPPGEPYVKAIKCGQQVDLANYNVICLSRKYVETLLPEKEEGDRGDGAKSHSQDPRHEVSSQSNEAWILAGSGK